MQKNEFFRIYLESRTIDGSMVIKGYYTGELEYEGKTYPALAPNKRNAVLVEGRDACLQKVKDFMSLPTAITAKVEKVKTRK